MIPTKNSQPRHFPYQHPTFGRGNSIKNESTWKRTIYYVWWSYLKRNEEYLKTCEFNGQGSLSKLYEDFGDVRADDFKTWWTEDGRGARLFSNPPAEDTVRLLSKSDEAPLDDDHLLVSVPLNLPKKFIFQRFKSLLNQKHNGQRGKQYAKTSKAKYQFKGQPNIEALATALNIWDKRIEQPKLKLWELGQFLPLNKHLYVDYFKSGKPLDTASKKLMEATVSRYIKKARDSLKNTSKGLFP
jgi:hypothetical protein